MHAHKMYAISQGDACASKAGFLSTHTLCFSRQMWATYSQFGCKTTKKPNGCTVTFCSNNSAAEWSQCSDFCGWHRCISYRVPVRNLLGSFLLSSADHKHSAKALILCLRTHLNEAVGDEVLVFELHLGVWQQLHYCLVVHKDVAAVGGTWDRLAHALLHNFGGQVEVPTLGAEPVVTG